MRNASFLSQDALKALGFATLGKAVLIHETCVLVRCDRIAIGDNVRIDPFCVLSAGESLEIGSNSHIAANVALMASRGISIGEFCGVSHGARVLSASDDFKAGALLGPQIPDEFRVVNSGHVRIERHGCVGANCVVLPGSTVREGATVGALSLILGEIEPWTVNAGVPARPVAKRDRDGVLRAEAAFYAKRS
jgi:acetyltransferase-like isoleucine patch superfamily enzyme